MALALFSDLPATRRREVGSAVAHYIAGVLDRDSMVSTVDTLWQSAALQPGDKVRTLKGSLRGEIVAVLEDGRIQWRAETGTMFIALPESLLPDN